jgi:DENN (AEX-3) domain/uDENN domain/Myotubularin protein
LYGNYYSSSDQQDTLSQPQTHSQGAVHTKLIHELELPAHIGISPSVSPSISPRIESAPNEVDRILTVHTRNMSRSRGQKLKRSDTYGAMHSPVKSPVISSHPGSPTSGHRRAQSYQISPRIVSSVVPSTLQAAPNTRDSQKLIALHSVLSIFRSFRHRRMLRALIAWRERSYHLHSPTAESATRASSLSPVPILRRPVSDISRTFVTGDPAGSDSSDQCVRRASSGTIDEVRSRGRLSFVSEEASLSNDSSMYIRVTSPLENRKNPPSASTSTSSSANSFARGTSAASAFHRHYARRKSRVIHGSIVPNAENGSPMIVACMNFDPQDNTKPNTGPASSQLQARLAAAHSASFSDHLSGLDDCKTDNQDMLSANGSDNMSTYSFPPIESPDPASADEEQSSVLGESDSASSVRPQGLHHPDTTVPNPQPHPHRSMRASVILMRPPPIHGSLTTSASDNSDTEYTDASCENLDTEAAPMFVRDGSSQRSRKHIVRDRWRNAVDSIIQLLRLARRSKQPSLLLEQFGEQTKIDENGTQRRRLSNAAVSAQLGSISVSSSITSKSAGGLVDSEASFNNSASGVLRRDQSESNGPSGGSRVSLAANDVSHQPVPPLAQRPLDYFVVFGVASDDRLRLWTLRESLRKLPSDLHQGAINDFNNAHQLKIDAIDRFPRTDHDDFPFSVDWHACAFPDGYNVRLSQQPTPFIFPAVLTTATGTQLFCSYLIYYELVTPEFLRRTSSADFRPASSSRPPPPKTKKLPPPPELYAPISLCLVSHYPFVVQSRSILAHMYLIAQAQYSCEAVIKQHMPTGGGGQISLEHFVSFVMSKVPIPIPGISDVELLLANKSINLSLSATRGPVLSKLPLHYLFSQLSVESILTVLAAMLSEHRIIFASSSLSTINLVCQCMLQLFFPFQWWYAYIPCISHDMIGVQEMPQPYMLGVRSQLLLEMGDMHDVVVVDIDHDQVRTSLDIAPLPKDSSLEMRHQLRKLIEKVVVERDMLDAQIGSNNSLSASYQFGADFDKHVYCTVLEFYSTICHGFRKFLFFIEDTPFFNGSAFVEWKLKQDPQARDFYEGLIQSRAFDIFLEDDQRDNVYHECLALPFSECPSFIDEEMQTPQVLNINIPVQRDEKALLDRRSRNCNSSSSSEQQFTPSSTWPMNEKLFVSHSPCDATLLDPHRQSPNGADSKRILRTHRPYSASISRSQNRVAQKMQKVFSIGSLDAGELEDLEQMFATPSAREELCKIIKQPVQAGTNVRCVSSDAFRLLVRILSLLLDICIAQRPCDFASPTSVLEAGTIYYMDTSDGRRIYLEEMIRKHKVWRDSKYWEHALVTHISESTNTATSEDSEQDQDQERTSKSIEEIVFEWLIHQCQRMLFFGVPSKIVIKITSMLCSKYEVARASRDTLTTLIKNVSAALHPM